MPYVDAAYSLHGVACTRAASTWALTQPLPSAPPTKARTIGTAVADLVPSWRLPQHLIPVACEVPHSLYVLGWECLVHHDSQGRGRDVIRRSHRRCGTSATGQGSQLPSSRRRVTSQKCQLVAPRTVTPLKQTDRAHPAESCANCVRTDGEVTPPLTWGRVPPHTLKRNENRVFRLLAVIVGRDREPTSDLGKRCSRAVGSRWSETGSA